MSTKNLSGGTVHDLPDDLRKAIKKHSVQEQWEDITSLARNEFICWATSGKKEETRVKRVAWMCESLEEGKRRPCCWPGCPHREKNSS